MNIKDCEVGNKIEDSNVEPTNERDKQFDIEEVRSIMHHLQYFGCNMQRKMKKNYKMKTEKCKVASKTINILKRLKD